MRPRCRAMKQDVPPPEVEFPEWLPPVIIEFVSTNLYGLTCGLENLPDNRATALLRRLVGDERMGAVWKTLAGLEPVAHFEPAEKVDLDRPLLTDRDVALVHFFCTYSSSRIYLCQSILSPSCEHSGTPVWGGRPNCAQQQSG